MSCMWQEIPLITAFLFTTRRDISKKIFFARMLQMLQFTAMYFYMIFISVIIRELHGLYFLSCSCGSAFKWPRDYVLVANLNVLIDSQVYSIYLGLCHEGHLKSTLKIILIDFIDIKSISLFLLFANKNVCLFDCLWLYPSLYLSLCLFFYISVKP